MKYNKVVVLGHFIISFDSVINGLLVLVMAPYFFGASQSSFIQLLASYASYVALFITAPIGAILFGRIGDKFGRKNILLISIMGIGIPTFMIGILPDHSIIGVTAPVLLILLRMLQGIFKGSEYAGVFIHNHETGNKKVSSTANILSVGCIGGCTAAISCFAVLQDGVPAWGWRIPFICGGIFTSIIFLFRTRIPETHDFIEVMKSYKISKTPLKDLIKNYRLETLTGFAVNAMLSATAYSSMIFGSRLFQQAGYSISQNMLFNVFNLLWMALSPAICGKIADKIGTLKQLKYGSLISIIAIYPTFLLIAGKLNFTKIYLFMIVITFLSSIISGCFAGYILRLFPTTCRYSGFSVSSSIGEIVGALTPFMMLLFSEIFESNLGCTIWLYLVTIPTFVLICIANRKIKKKGFAGEC